MTNTNPFRYFRTSPEILRLADMMYVRFPLPLRNVGGLLYEHCIDVSYESVQFGWHRFGPIFAAEIRRNRVQQMRLLQLAVAPGRGFREDQWRGTLPLARGRSRKRGAGILCLQAQGSQSSFEILQEIDEALRPACKKFDTPQASLRIHFNHERALYSRDSFKLNRTAALVELRGLGSA